MFTCSFQMLVYEEHVWEFQKDVHFSSFPMFLIATYPVQDRTPNDDNLPDQIAEIFHDLSHASHAMSDLSFNFNAPAPQSLMCFPSLSPMKFPHPFQGGLMPPFPGVPGAPGAAVRNLTTAAGNSSQVRFLICWLILKTLNFEDV